MRRLGDQFTITAELTNAANDSVMWTYAKPSRTADAFALQRELVDSIIARFQLAPRYVDAHLGKVSVFTVMADAYQSPRTVVPRVQAILAVVAGIDSSRADYWGARALLNASWIWDWPTVRSDAARARAIEPLNANALFAEAVDRLASGNGTAFMATIDTIQRSDPLSPLPPIQRLVVYSFAGMRDSVQAALQRLPDDLRKGSYGDVFEGIATLALGRDADAERAFREGELELGHPSPLRVVALARLGRTAEARTQLTRAERAFGKPYSPPELIAAGAAELGDTTAMYRWLEIGQRERSSWAILLGLWDRPFVAHRQEPHFQRILQQMGVKPVTFGSRPSS